MQKIIRVFNGIGEMSSKLDTPVGLVFTVLFLVAVIAVILSWIMLPKLKWKTETRNTFRRFSVWLAVGIYFAGILGCMYLLRDPAQGYQMQLIPLYGITDRTLLYGELLSDLGSFMLFIPLGILFLAQYAGEYPLACAAMFAFGGSLATEVLQYILKMGTFCTEDMICAALGGVLGALLVLAWKKTQGKKSLGGIVLRIVFGLCSFVFVLGIVTFGTYHVLRMTGEKSMRENISDVSMNMESEKKNSSDLIWYDGKAYKFNDQAVTILCMGIDQQSEEIQQIDNLSGESGQADSIFLVVLNPVNRQMNVIAISRDTMTEIATYDAKGNYIGDSVNHLGLAYAFGNGKDTSCEYMVHAVSKLFYGIPINGYAAFNMETISKLNDAVGGVTVTVPEGENLSEDLKAGTTVTLKGSQAETFVRYRDTEMEGSNNLRIARQREFVLNFFTAAVDAMKKDVSLPVTLYQQLTDEMVTDIGLDNAVYLATEAAGMQFGEGNLIMLQGEAKAGKVYDEFYVDDAKLYELILNTFYTEVALK